MVCGRCATRSRRRARPTSRRRRPRPSRARRRARGERQDLAGESDDDEGTTRWARRRRRARPAGCAAGLRPRSRVRRPTSRPASSAWRGPTRPGGGRDALHRELRAWAICPRPRRSRAARALSEARAGLRRGVHGAALLCARRAPGARRLADAGAAQPDAPRALVAALAQYPRDGQCGASDLAFENAVAGCVEIKLRAPTIPTCGTHWLISTGGGAFCLRALPGPAARDGGRRLPLYLDVAEARRRTRRPGRSCPARAGGRQAALAQVAAARPPPGWAVAVAGGSLRARPMWSERRGAAGRGAEGGRRGGHLVDAATRCARSVFKQWW